MVTNLPILDAALAYALHGWHVLPVEPRGKRPLPALTPHGVHDATTDHMQIRDWWARQPDANVAIATGVGSELLVVDLDVRPDRGIDGRETWRELVRQHGPVDTLQSITGGGGTHLMLRTSVRVRSSAGALGPGVDVRGDGGYIVAPPSLHASRRTYEWDGGECSPALVADAPAWLLAACVAPAAPAMTSAAKGAAVTTLDQRQEDELRSALAVLDPDGYDQWLRVGMALHSTGADAQAFRIWCEWARRSAKFDLPDHERRWRGFEPHGGVTVATIFGLARDAGWTQEPAATVVSVEDLPEPPAADVRPEPPVPPGFLRTVASYIVDTAVHPQPDLAVAAAIAAAATILGGRVCDEQRARTNLYLLGVIRTGGGKERGREVIKEICMESGNHALLGGEEVYSGQGLLSALTRSATSIFLLDEFGMKMQTAASEGPSGTTFLLIGALMKLFSAARSVLLGTEYADQRARPRAILEHPCCVLYATTTPGTLYAGLTAGAARSGFLPRLLVVEAARVRRTKPVQRTLPSDVLAWVRDVCQGVGTPSTSLDGRARATPRVLVATQAAAKILDDYGDWADSLLHRGAGDPRRDDAVEDVWTRTSELSYRLALVAACSAEPQTTTIDATSAQWAVDYARVRAEWLVTALRDHVGDTEYARTRIDFLTSIRGAGKMGVSHRDLGRLRPFCDAKPRDRMAVLEDLVASGQVARVSHQTSGRPREAWIAVQDDEAQNG